ncbi:MAG: FAD-dependent oxidoreductase [Clostridia bacterium]|nr:FAD-dependent oxidoreductase [Clostridia bacterium]
MKEYDLIVVGGGLAGVASAVSAKRQGLNVLIIERSGCFGGAISNNLVYPFMRYWQDNPDDTYTLLSAGIFSEIRELAEQYEKADSLMNFKPQAIKLTLDKLIVDSGVDFLFHSTVYSVTTKNDKVKSVKVLTKSTKTEFFAKYFIDATGDGELIYYAGCDYQLGRESDNLCQPMTTCFRISGVDLDRMRKDYPTLQQKWKELKSKGQIKNPRENILSMIGLGEGILHLNTTRVVKLNPTDAFEISRAEVIAREQVYELFHFLKAHSTAFENSTIISVANEIGVRESRKLKGVHILTEQEIISCKRFEDAIALGNYEIDVHNPEGTGTYLHYFKQGEVYSIPYRSLLPKEYTNLLVAGRCLSATHQAHSAVRILPICTCLGQAAGTAIALAEKTTKNTHTINTATLRDMLKQANANV